MLFGIMGKLFIVVTLERFHVLQTRSSSGKIWALETHILKLSEKFPIYDR